ncbi:hypothetical protein C0Q70_11450 [Pomacea canaliculata]|uniref:Uncharacterized protein n=1 Tax=Pomacea canaliculata TaxID=400727 RepID=A0A2T7P601_POMCA|nr:hypothetical protein C0Q70_11450 [Pomacea canaliculata]
MAATRHRRRRQHRNGSASNSALHYRRVETESVAGGVVVVSSHPGGGVSYSSFGTLLKLRNHFEYQWLSNRTNQPPNWPKAVYFPRKKKNPPPQLEVNVCYLPCTMSIGAVATPRDMKDHPHSRRLSHSSHMFPDLIESRLQSALRNSPPTSPRQQEAEGERRDRGKILHNHAPVPDTDDTAGGNGVDEDDDGDENCEGDGGGGGGLGGNGRGDADGKFKAAKSLVL